MTHTRDKARPRFTAWLLIAAGMAVVPHAQAQRYPDKPITVVVPMSAGGTADLLARTLAPRLSANVGQPVMVENRPGANGILGEEYFSQVKPDGYTIMLESTSIVTNPATTKLRYDPATQFVPVTQLAAVPLVLVVNSAVPANSTAEFVELARTKPGSVTYASWGNASMGHFAGEMFKIATKTDVRHIPYRATAQAVTDTMGGQVNAMFPTISLALPHANSGKLRLLAVTSPVRSPLAPQVPTMAEAGIPGMNVETWFGVFLPKGASLDHVATLHREFSRLLSDSTVRTTLEGQGFRLIGSSPTEFSRTYQDEIQRYGEVVRQVGIKDDK